MEAPVERVPEEAAAEVPGGCVVGRSVSCPGLCECVVGTGEEEGRSR